MAKKRTDPPAMPTSKEVSEEIAELYRAKHPGTEGMVKISDLAKSLGMTTEGIRYRCHKKEIQLVIGQECAGYVTREEAMRLAGL